MIIVGSTNADVGIQQGMDILKNGGSAMDAVEATIRLVEDNPDDHTVGYNSYPNILGDLQLDASIMDGATLEAGAIAAVQGFRCLLYTSPSPRDRSLSRMPSSA